MTNAPVSVHRRDTSLEDFFNVFNHRFISFLYRAWASCRKAVDYDRPQESKFSGYVGSFVGLGMESLKQRLAVPDEALLFFSGHFANRSRHAGGLSAVVADYFGTSAEVVENAGQWIDIPEGDRGALGGMGGVPLGQGLVVGARIWDRQLKFILRLGPMSHDAYERLFPGKVAHESLKSLVQFYTNRELYCSVNLILAKEEYPGTRLGGGARLGLSTWLHASKPADDLDDLFLSLQ